MSIAEEEHKAHDYSTLLTCVFEFQKEALLSQSLSKFIALSEGLACCTLMYCTVRYFTALFSLKTAILFV